MLCTHRQSQQAFPQQLRQQCARPKAMGSEGGSFPSAPSSRSCMIHGMTHAESVHCELIIDNWELGKLKIFGPAGCPEIPCRTNHGKLWACVCALKHIRCVAHSQHLFTLHFFFLLVIAQDVAHSDETCASGIIFAVFGAKKTSDNYQQNYCMDS